MNTVVTSKEELYADLVQKRKACRLCAELQNPSVIEKGEFDSDQIGPYSRWQGNLNARLLVVGKDFADTKTFRCVSGWPGSGVPTNCALVELLKEAGIQIVPPRFGQSDNKVFFTNAVLCMKEPPQREEGKRKKKGGMQTHVPVQYFRNCAQKFLRQTIQIIQPQAVATLGEDALNATLLALEMPKERRKFSSLVGGHSTYDLGNGKKLFPMAHPSPTVQNTTRSLEDQRADWKKLGKWLDSACTTKDVL